MTNFIAILIVGIGTYLFRSIFILALADRTIPTRVIRALEYVAPAVLSALIVALLIDPDARAVVAGLPEVGALAVGGAVAWKTRNLIYVVLAGMAVFWLLRLWF